MRVQLNFVSHIHLHLYVYNDEKQVLFNGDFVRENIDGTGTQTSDLPTNVFFIAAVTFLTGFLAYSYAPGSLLVTSTLGDLVVAAIATISVG